jgi:hypothetical protein
LAHSGLAPGESTPQGADMAATTPTYGWDTLTPEEDGGRGVVSRDGEVTIRAKMRSGGSHAGHLFLKVKTERGLNTPCRSSAEHGLWRRATAKPSVSHDATASGRFR